MTKLIYLLGFLGALSIAYYLQDYASSVTMPESNNPPVLGITINNISTTPNANIQTLPSYNWPDTPVYHLPFTN